VVWERVGCGSQPDNAANRAREYGVIKNIIIGGLDAVKLGILRWKIALGFIRGTMTFLELVMVTTKGLLEIDCWWTLCNSIPQIYESKHVLPLSLSLSLSLYLRPLGPINP
jgi:hypothetical protein